MTEGHNLLYTCTVTIIVSTHGLLITHRQPVIRVDLHHALEQLLGTLRQVGWDHKVSSLDLLQQHSQIVVVEWESSLRMREGRGGR